ncbi:protein ASPARTIC PROTEASE IN GUARD CELL 1-like [Impatiens glandulifera]|uniref:protein ASPARTIC PROTEASE IN GUARD CELL 1-like n=1 Tax=Impatiens glandulifera TaxID=253017 RepID=UPI001FB151DD|nr:protein ASPARTIC PROTEASE IN GUARD CELL 1-like [Impatiens glandulifera]
MADTTIFFFFTLFSFSSYFTLVLSRTLLLQNSQTTTTTVLHVSASLQKTTQTFPLNQSALQKPKPTSSSLSFDLHSRFSIHRASHNVDYKSLTLTRLQRDSIRVKSLQTRLDLAVTGLTQSDLTPIQTELAADKLQTPVISGISQGSGEYFSRIGIGKPAKDVYMVLDTGSDVNWMQCAPCADCYQQSDPIFEPTSSSSYSPLTCDTRQCRSLDVSECRNETCLYQVSYGDGSYTVGELVTETVTFGKSEEVNKIAIGCGHNNEGLFIGAAGLIGLGGGSLSFPSQINASSFSYCLVDRDSDSVSTLEFNSGIPPSAVTATLLRNTKLDTFYYVDLIGITVAGVNISIETSVFKLESNGSGGVIIDSGTAVTRLQTEAYNAVRDEFVKRTKELVRVKAVELFDTCYDLSSMKIVDVPKIGFRFSNGKVLSLPAKNYLIPVDSAGTFCFAFAPTSSTVAIIGNVQQQGIRVSFDLVNSLVGFSPSIC